MNELPPQTILVVDDVPGNIAVLSGILRGHYKVKAAPGGARALEIATNDPQPDLILLDVMMPEMDGYEVLCRLQADPRTASIPVIFVTALDDEADEYKGLDLGAVDYIAKPVSPNIVLARIRTHLALHQQHRLLEDTVQARTEELRHTQLEIIQRLGRAAEFRDNETGLHVIRMSHYSRLLVQATTNNGEWIDLVFNAAPMHDIGKIGIPDHILLKPGKLSPDEWEVMARHPLIGAQIIGDDPSPLMRMSRDIAENHHEKWDGSGYPFGRAGAEIPLAARIVAVADVFDALTTARPYKPAWSVEDSVALIDRERGRHFDPHLVDVFHHVLPEILKIMRLYQDQARPYRQS